MPRKTDKQWMKDNGVPEHAKHVHLWSTSLVAVINSQLRHFGLRIRTKYRRGHGTGSFLWVESL